MRGLRVEHRLGWMRRRERGGGIRFDQDFTAAKVRQMPYALAASTMCVSVRANDESSMNK